MSRERVVLLAISALAVLGLPLGLAFHPSGSAHPNVALQALDLLRVLTTVALTVAVVLGPGLLLRAGNPRHRPELGFLPLPGLGLLAITGGLAWALAKEIDPRLVCALVLAPVLGWLLVSLLRARREDVLTSGERRALLITAAALGVAIARTIWSLSPPGELYGGSIFRTLEVAPRPDSRISFHVVQLVANGLSPFGAASRSFFFPYTFSSRGPLAGIASAPIVLLTGGRPPTNLVSHPWSPFDRQGFMSYRLAMMTFDSTVFMSLWTLTRRVGGNRAARLALLLAATTPFLVHEIWFTWPKLLAASFVLLAAASVIGGRPLAAGLLVGAGYLIHPLALLSVPALALLALWPLHGARARSPALRPALLLLAGLAVYLVGWRLINGSHYTQTKFFDFLTRPGQENYLHALLIRGLGGHPPPVTFSEWLDSRLVSVGNTLVPMRLFFLSAHDSELNALTRCFPFCGGHSPAIIHFFIQYWTSVPFGLGITFFPLLLYSLWRALRTWPWALTATVIVPFVLFAIYWGSFTTGLLREGLHAWVLTLLVVVALLQHHDGFSWLRSGPVRALLALRSLEVLLVALLPTIVTRARLYGPSFVLTDVVAVLGIVLLCGTLGAWLWRERAPVIT